MTKNLYVTPETEVLEVRFEENFCGTADGSWNNSIKSGSTWGTASGDDPYGLE